MYIKGNFGFLFFKITRFKIFKMLLIESIDIIEKKIKFKKNKMQFQKNFTMY